MITLLAALIMADSETFRCRVEWTDKNGKDQSAVMYESAGKAADAEEQIRKRWLSNGNSNVVANCTR